VTDRTWGPSQPVPRGSPPCGGRLHALAVSHVSRSHVNRSQQDLEEGLVDRIEAQIPVGHSPAITAGKLLFQSDLCSPLGG